MAEVNDALIARALELANHLEDEYWQRDVNEGADTLRAIVTRLQAAERVCEAAEKIVPGCSPLDLVGLYKPIDDWRAARGGNGGEG